MKFETEKIVTGIVERVSKKTNKTYRMIMYLNDDGTTFTSMLQEDVKIPEGLKQLDLCNVVFEVTFYNGNVNGLKDYWLEYCKMECN